jgi:hypothetical protein
MKVPIFNYRRNFISKKGVYVPRIILPLKLPQYTTSVFSTDDILPEHIIWRENGEVTKAFVQKYEATHDGKDGFLYVVRHCSLVVRKLLPPC